METRRIKTLVRAEHKLGKDVFVRGRIMGAMAILCKEDPITGIEFGWGRCDDGCIYLTETTDEKYEAFTKVIEGWYPGLCIFDYMG